MSLRIIVCGGRGYEDARALFMALNALLAKYPVAIVIHGAARGADNLAGQWAKHNNIEVKACPADWELYGRRAGHVRNRHMLNLGVDCVVAFPGGRGTSDMARQARKEGVRVWTPYGGVR